MSAWASETGLVLAQRALADKGSEVGTHADIAGQIRAQGGDDVLALKGHQGRLAEDVHALFAAAARVAYAGIAHTYDRQVDGGHGRIEIRETWALTDPAHLAYVDPAGTWVGLRSLVMVRAERRLGPALSVETRSYLSSLQAPARPIGAAVRRHWGSENSVHWVLDMAFREDQSRVRLGHAARNLALLRRLALNLLRRETSRNVGIQTKRLKAGWDHAYLLAVLQA